MRHLTQKRQKMGTPPCEELGSPHQLPCFAVFLASMTSRKRSAGLPMHIVASRGSFLALSG